MKVSTHTLYIFDGNSEYYIVAAKTTAKKYSPRTV